MKEIVGHLCDHVNLLKEYRIWFHDVVEHNGWKLWISNGPAYSDGPQAQLIGKVAGFQIELKVITRGYVDVQIPTEDEKITADLLRLFQLAIEGLQGVIARKKPCHKNES